MRCTHITLFIIVTLIFVSARAVPHGLVQRQNTASRARKDTVRSPSGCGSKSGHPGVNLTTLRLEGDAAVAPGRSVRRQTFGLPSGAGDYEGAEPFLIPLLPFGLSNQVIAMKEVMAIAAIFNWTVVSLGFWPHSSELEAVGISKDLSPLAHRRLMGGKHKRQEGRGMWKGPLKEPTVGKGQQKQRAQKQLAQKQLAQKQLAQKQLAQKLLAGKRPAEQDKTHQPRYRVPMIPFDTIFDRRALAPLVRVITPEEASRKYGWSRSGRVDSVVCLMPSLGMTATLDKATTAGLLDVRGIKAVKNSGFRCDDRGLAWLSETVAGQRWVVLYAYRGAVPAARSHYRSPTDDASRCVRMYDKVTLKLSKSQIVTTTAQDFITAALAGLPQQHPTAPTAGGGVASGSIAAPYYIALHVRPYPDQCLEYFVRMTSYDHEAASKVCRNPKLMIRMVPLVRRLMEQRAALVASSSAARAGSIARQPSSPPPPPVALFIMSHPRVRDVVRREVRRLWALDDKASKPDPGEQEEVDVEALGDRARRRDLRVVESAEASGADVETSSAAEEGASSAGEDGTSSAGEEGARSEGMGGSSGGLVGAAAASLRMPPLFFLDVADLPAQLRHHLASNSLLSMVEQEVCRMAYAFIGTSASSISVLVAQERVAADAEAAAAPGAEGAWDGGGEGGGGGPLTVLF